MNYVTHCINKDIASADRTSETTMNLLCEYLSTSDLVTKFFDVSGVTYDDENSRYYMKLIPLAENLNDTYIWIYADSSYMYIKYKDTNNTIDIANSLYFSYDLYVNICCDESQIKISLIVSSSSAATMSFNKFFMITSAKNNTGEVSPVLFFTNGQNDYLNVILNKSTYKLSFGTEGGNINDNSGYVLLRKYSLITRNGYTLSFDKVYTVFGASSLPTRFTVNNKEYFGFDKLNICALFN